MKVEKIYVYGYGNPGRSDDGLGAAIIKKLEDEKIPEVVTDCNYQLNIEDADNISSSDVVIFVDASFEAKEPFEFRGIEPAADITFTTHAMSPESVLALCQDIYGKHPKAYVLAIRGYNWDFAEGLSSKAIKNLEEAYLFLMQKIRDMLSGKE